MENQTATAPNQESSKFRLGCLPVLGIMGAVVVVTALLTGWWMKHYLYASNFTPTTLNAKEKQVLDRKLARLEESARGGGTAAKESVRPGESPLEPERYTEAGAKREIHLTERELNSLIANRPDIAQRVAIDLSDDMVSVKLVVPMDQDILFFGGKTLRLNLGLNLAYENARPVVALQGVTLGGIPIPNAWLGNLKYKNLVDEFGTESGFWKLFAQGVEDIRIKEGQLSVKLKE